MKSQPAPFLRQPGAPLAAVFFAGLLTLLFGTGNAVQAQVTNTIGTTTYSSSSTLTIAAGNVTLSTGTINFTANSTSTYTAIMGPGTLQLAATGNGVNSPDIYFNNNDTDNSTANWGTRIGAPVNLGSTQRVIFGKTNHSGVDKYGVGSTDCEFTNNISGAAGLTYIAQDSYTGSNPMECPLALDASNSFTGPLIIQRGSVYLGAAGAFPAGDVLQFNVASGNNGKFFLYGINTTVANLTSAGAGTALIANGNRNPSPIAAATLTVTETTPTTYAGTLIDTNVEYANTGGSSATTLSLVKNGSAALTLTGTVKFTGPMTVSAGKLYMNTTSSGGGAVTVNNGGTLGGAGSIVGPVTVANGGTLEAGNGAGAGTLTNKTLTLGGSLSDAITLNLTGTASGIATLFAVTNLNGLTNNGTVTINVTGTLPVTAPATYNLLTYSGAVKGGGTFVVGSLPGLTGYVSNNAAASVIQLVIPPQNYTSLTWTGSPTNNWDLSGSNVWVFTGGNTPTAFTNGSGVVFGDTASNFTVNLASAVNPGAVVFSNNVNSYFITGKGGITGTLSYPGSLTLQGGGTVTLATTNAYAGNTAVNAGKLVLGAAGALPGGSGAGSVTVNGTLDLGGFSPVLNNLSGTGTVDNVSAGGTPQLSISNSTGTTFSGVIQNSSGSLAVNLSGSGSLTLGTNNSYTGGTTIAGGGLVLLTSGGGGSGTVTVTEDLAGGTGTVLSFATNAPVVFSNNLVLPNASGTYALSKNASGALKLAGNLSGGGSGLTLRLTTDTAGDATTPIEPAGNNGAFNGNIQLYRGTVLVDSGSSLGTGTIYCDGNNSTVGDLAFNANLTLTNNLVLQAATSLFTTNTVTLPGTLTGAATASVTKYGVGTVNLLGGQNYNGALNASAGTLGIGSVLLAGDTTSGGGLGASYTNVINIAAGATVVSYGNLVIYESSSLQPYIAVTGAGTLLLAATNNSASSPDISFAANDTTANSTANWGDRIACSINLGSQQRYIWGRTDHTGVDVYGVNQADCQFAGPISGSGGLTFDAQNNSSGSNGQLMETPFCLNATNSFTGPVQIMRGSVYLGTNNAFPAGNILQFNVASGNTGKFFLYGHNTTVSDLSASNSGNAFIADGNRNPSSIGPAILTIVQNHNASYNGVILDTNAEYTGTNTGNTTTLSLVKAGPASLTLAGNLGFSGPLTVNAGELFINSAATGGGKVTVNSGGTLGGNGSISAFVTVSNGAALEAGGGSGYGTLTVNNLALGANPVTDAVTLNFEAVPAGVNSLTVAAANGCTNNATVTVNLSGVLPAFVPATYNLINYSGTVQGSGTFVLGSLPDSAVAYLTNNASAKALQLVVSSVNIPTLTWYGSPTNDWDLAGSLDWLQGGTPAAYAEYNQVIFDDTATNFYVALDSAVNPDGVVFSNSINSYLVSGPGGISGFSSLTKLGAAPVALAVNNSYSGPTTVSAGILSLAAAGAVPGGPGAGNVTVNGTLDINGFNPTLNNLSGNGTVDNLTAGGSLVLNLTNSTGSVFAGALKNTSGSLEVTKTGSGTLALDGANTFSGLLVISNGTVQIGNNDAAGSLGSGTVFDLATLAFDRTDAVTVANSITGTGGIQQNGPGQTTLTGNLTYTGPTVVNAGTLVFPNDVTYDASLGQTLAVASNALAETGFEIFLNANSGGNALDMAGPGTVRFVSRVNNVEAYADMIIGANNNGISTANYGITLSAGLDLGTTNRLFWAYSSRDDVTTYGIAGCDCNFAGPLSGSSQLTLLGKNSWPGVNPMEEQFAFTATNSWTGVLEVQRGSIYVGNPNAFTTGNTLILDPAASVNARLFLHGNNATFANLQSGGYGQTVVANGNNLTSSNVGPATLTVVENQSTTFNGNIVDWFTEYTAPATGPLNPTLSLVKNGAANLTLTGTNTYTGATTVNAGTLTINGIHTGGGAVLVASNATLAGSGVLKSVVTVKNGGAVTSGSSGGGALQLSGLNLGTNSGDLSVLNLNPAAVLDITNNNGFVLKGGTASVTVNISGQIPGLGAFPLITYTGSLGGTGFASFQLGALPPGIAGYLSNDTANASVDFVATLVTTPRWTGAYSSDWNTNSLPAPKNWVLNSDGVSTVDYVDGENVRMDDSASNATVSIRTASVAPASVTVSNSVLNYLISGSYGITGGATLTKQGAGGLTVSTTNSYSGNTLVLGGLLSLGNAKAVPGGAGAGNVLVNATLDLAGFSPVFNNLAGTGIVDNVSAGGAPVLTVDETSGSTFAGALKNTTGSLGLIIAGSGPLILSGTNTYTGPTTVSGSLVLNGKLANTVLTVNSGASFGGSGTLAGPATLNNSAFLNLTANAPLNLGRLTLNGTVTVNISGTVTTTNSATYVLLNYTNISSTNLFSLAPVAGILNSGFTASLNATTNQLTLVIARAKGTGTIADVRHVVIFTQENRSFDHYLGALHGIHGFSDHIMLTLQNGNSVLYQPSGSSYELPFHTSVQCIADLAHSWSDAHQEWDNGWHDQWIAAKGTESMAFYNRSDMPYHYALADAYTVCDEYHCSVLTSTDPNRLYIFSGMIDPNGTGGGPVTANTEPAAGWSTNWVTAAETLQKAGVSWKVYQASDNYDDNALAWFAAFKNAPTSSPLYINGVSFVSNLTNGFAADVSNNTLPSVSWIVGPDYASEHPYWGPGAGADLIHNLLTALAANPTVYNSTVFILNWDEGDGYYDHEIPVNPPTGTASEFVSGQPIGLGERVPCIVVSPWSRGGYVCSQVFDHTSTLRLIETWTGVRFPNISAWRRQVCGDMTSVFDFAHPNTNFPAILNTEPNTVCGSGTTANPPGSQTVPVQESGTLIQRPLPYQPNAFAVLDGSGNVNVFMTNSGTASVHYSLYPNAYSTILPVPFDVNPSNSLTSAYSTTTTSGNYDFSLYSPNGFLRRFAGNVTADYNKIDAVPYFNPITDGFKTTLANASSSAVTFTVTNGWFAGSQSTYTVPALTTNVVFLDASTNNGWYDLTVTASSDSLFVRRFAGHIETNVAPVGLISSENPSGFKDLVTFTASFAGYGTPTGTVQFRTNGIAFGSPVKLTNGVASFATSLLPRGTNDLVTAEYSGDLVNAPATNSLIQTVLDHPPVPGTVAYQRVPGRPLNILISDLLTHVTDVDGDPMTLVGVGTDGFNLTTTNGVMLSTNANYITYTNSVPSGVNDQFEYTVSDGYGGVSLGTVIILIDTNTIVTPNTPLLLSSSNASVNFFGAPGVRYEIDRTTNLAPGTGTGWVPISTNVAPDSGIIQVQDQFLDLNSQHPSVPGAAYYRLKANP